MTWTNWKARCKKSDSQTNGKVRYNKWTKDKRDKTSISEHEKTIQLKGVT